MGSRGPIGDRPEVRRLKGVTETVEPRPRPVVPTCPRYLNKIARREWRRIVPELDRLGMLTAVDGAALESYCNAYANMVQAQTVLNDEGMTFVTDTGYVGQRPEVAIVNKSLAAIKSFCAEFGLTPAGRARMAIPDKPAAEDEMDQFLRGG